MRFGPYEILEPLGEGGMGRVYRAHDGTLRRDVAIKLLPEEVADDPERLARLKREARSLAALNHPHIATVHGFEEQENTSFIVMELVEGETLAERLEAGSLTVEKALEVGIQIARALEAAHERGIVHRDLKPDNVKITPSGDAKVLDFGLAKPLQGETKGSATELPTATLQTRTGAILGTPPYMSPEQVRGEGIDERTDIWAFGCVLYELLTGRGPFERETVADTLSAILSEEPKWDALPAETPRMVRWLLSRCLEKDSDQRLRDFSDLRLLLSPTTDEPGEESHDGATEGSEGVARSLVAAAALVVGIGLGWLVTDWFASPESSPGVVRFSLFADPEDPEMRFDSWQLSPDGGLLAYQTSAGRRGNPSAIHVRSLEEGSTRVLRDTEGSTEFAFSPAGKRLVYRSATTLASVHLEDGRVETISSLDPGWQNVGRRAGIAWADEGFLVLSPFVPRGLWRIEIDDGETERLTMKGPADPDLGAIDHLQPVDVPGDRFLLFTVRRIPSETHIALLSLAEGEHRPLTDDGTSPGFVSPGYLTYVHQERLFAQRFDPADGHVSGEAIMALAGVSGGPGGYSVAREGSLAYAPAGDGVITESLAIVRASGETEEVAFEGTGLRGPRVAPDGGRFVVAVVEDKVNLWLRDMERATSRQLTDESGDEWWSAWTPDGRLVFQSNREDGSFLDLYVMDPDRPGSTRKVVDGGRCHLQPQESTADGILLYQKSCPSSGALDVWAVDVATWQTRPILETGAREKHPSVSPDGRWLAFASDTSGRDQVYVTSYPEPGRFVQVTPTGGEAPKWGPDGRELFFVSGNDLYVVELDHEAPDLAIGRPQRVLDGAVSTSDWGREYDVFPDGRLLARFPAVTLPREVRIVLNWSLELRDKLGTR